ncbi:hypothetical protein BJ165DRAFT_1005036 [Panaeolus papilionaceus]|nr:hypothetical protein BJ165DRAFT_1005036 [Panaeolus papilionaceus]
MSNKGEDNDMDFRLDRVVISEGDIAVTPPQQTTNGNLPPSVSTTFPSSTSTPSAPTARSSSTSLSSSIGSSTDLSSSLSPSSTASRSFSSGTSLSISSTTQTLTPGASPAQATETIIVAKEKSDAPIIAGAVIGTVVFLAVLGALLFIFVRKNRYANRIPESPEQSPPPMLSTSSLVSPFTDPQSSNNSANAPVGDNFTTKPISSSRLGRQTAATLSYIGSPASRGNPSESESPSSISPIQSEKHSPLFNTSVTTTDLNSANNSRDDYPYRDLERPPSYAPTPLLSRDPPSAP